MKGAWNDGARLPANALVLGFFRGLAALVLKTQLGPLFGGVCAASCAETRRDLWCALTHSKRVSGPLLVGARVFWRGCAGLYGDTHRRVKLFEQTSTRAEGAPPVAAALYAKVRCWRSLFDGF